MNISIHGVKKVMIENSYKIPGRDSRACTLCVIDREGRHEITLYADKADKLEIVKVKDSSDFYEPEPLEADGQDINWRGFRAVEKRLWMTPALLYALGCALGAVFVAGVAMWTAEWLLALVIWKVK